MAAMAAVEAQVYVPSQEHDIRNYRLIPLMPNVFLEDSTRYVMFMNELGEYVLTMEAVMDNNNGGPIESDGIDGVARGIFFQDATYGSEALDGWVVSYDATDYVWKQTSVALSYAQFNFAQDNLDLTVEESNGAWTCDVAIDPNPSPTYEFVRCSRVVPDNSDYDTQQIRYQPYIVVNAIGYKFWGYE